MSRHRLCRTLMGVTLLASFPDGAQATWSIVIADSNTREVAVGTVTCLDAFDLLAIVPVVVVGKGAAAVQSAGDFNGIRRPIIFEQFTLGTDPEQILDMLAGISGHQQRQYGIADTQGRAVTFSGTANAQWAGGVIGWHGSMVYAIQGNILTGDCVVPAIEEAVLNTDGDVPARLMAGMEAARQAGGDGRCSCSQGNPTGCGCPPADFTKSGHIGGMVVARIGDADDPVCDAGGCVDGDYFMRLNVAFQGASDPDPVFQLRDLFDAWRADHVGRPDAVGSVVTFDPPQIPPDGASITTMGITLLDFAGEAIIGSVDSIAVEHAPDSDGRSTIGALVDEGGGVYTITITAGGVPGLDRFRIIVDDGIRPVTLMPDPALRYYPFGDGNFDGDVDLADFEASIECHSGPDADAPPPCAPFDFDGDGDVDRHDAGALQLGFTGDCDAVILVQPQNAEVCLNATAVFEVVASGVDLSYQWYLDGIEIPDASEDTLVVEPVTPEVIGTYSVRVSGRCPTVSSDGAGLAILDPPAILGHPESLSVCLGDSAVFSASAAGVEPLSYQWRFNNVDMAGATAPVFTIAEVQAEDVGAYRCRVTDGCGRAAFTDSAGLGTRDAVFTLQPSGGEVCSGGTIFLLVSATGTPTYQWFHDDEPIAGATGTVLIVSNVSASDAGVYHAVATNDCNAVASDDAVMDVIDCE